MTIDQYASGQIVGKFVSCSLVCPPAKIELTVDDGSRRVLRRGNWHHSQPRTAGGVGYRWQTR